MSIELTGLTIATIKINDSLSIPVVKAIVNYDGSSLTTDEYNALQAAIFNRILGTSLAVGGQLVAAQYSDVPITTIPTNATYGGSTGFKLVYKRNTNATYPSTDGDLYFDDVRVSYVHHPGGYITYAPFVILVDSSNKIWRNAGFVHSFLSVRIQSSSQQIPTFSVNNSILYVESVPNLGELQTTNLSGSMTLASRPIDEYIEEEDDPSDPEDDPYNKDPSDPGDFDDGTSDDIDFPSPPPISVTDTGFITLYNPSLAQLQGLAGYMWSSAFDLDTFRKLFANPMDAILGLSLIPVSIPGGAAQTVKVGNISTTVTMTVAGSQYVTVDCGTVTVKKKSPGSYLDYAPYTKADLYLPCIGTHPIDVDEIMGKTIHIKYMVDILSGACTAYVKVGGSVLYEYNGSCAVSIPITGNDWTNVLNGAVSVAASIGTMVATGGATAPMAASTIASAAVNNLKPSIEKSGSLGGPGGILGVKRPYLILSRPNRQIPKNQNKFIGYPTYINKKIKDVSGYIVVEDVHLDGIAGATAEELSEIEALLKSGVIA